MKKSQLNAPTILIYFLYASFLLTGVIIVDEKILGYHIIPLVIYSMRTGVPIPFDNHFTDGPEVFTAIWLYTDQKAYSEGEPITLGLYNVGRYVAVFDSSFRVDVVDGTRDRWTGIAGSRYLFSVKYSDTTILEEGQFTQIIFLDGLPPGKYRIFKGVRVGYEPNLDGRKTWYDTIIYIKPEIPEEILR